MTAWREHLAEYHWRMLNRHSAAETGDTIWLIYHRMMQRVHGYALNRIYRE